MRNEYLEVDRRVFEKKLIARDKIVLQLQWTGGTWCI
jgi:hypothetical protein